MSALSWFRQQLRKVSSIIALIGGALAIAFLIWVFGDSERRIASIDHRNVADLAILVDNLEQWPRAAQSIGDANFYSGSWQAPILRPVKGGIEKELYHPDFDTFWIRYSAGNPDCSSVRTIERDSAGEGLLRVEGFADRPDADAPALPGLGPGSRPLCYALTLRLADILQVREVARGFSHLLIADAEGRIVAQIGEEPLPIRRVSELPKLQTALREIAATLDPNLQRKPDAAPRDALEPIDTRIAGTAYRLYQRPFRLDAAPSATAAPANRALIEARLVEGADGRVNAELRKAQDQAAPAAAMREYTAIGVAPRARVDRETSRVPNAVLTAFLLSFALLLALMPALKLRLLGPVDDLAPLEAGAAVLGFLVAVWVATISVGYAVLLLQGREQAEQRAVASARWIADDVGRELRHIVGQGAPPQQTLLHEMARTIGAPSGSEVVTLSRAPECAPGQGCDVAIPQPDGVFMANRDGRQTRGTPVVTIRDGAGANSKVGRRGYFRRAIAGDLLEPVAEPRIAPLPCLSSRFAIDQVRSLPDGMPRTVLGFPVRSSCCGGGSSICVGRSAGAATGANERPAVLVTAMVLRSLLAPVLPSDVEFIIVDPDDPRLRALFHSVASRAQVESLSDGLSGWEVEGARARLRNNPPPPCGPGDAPPPQTFSASYDGRARTFAAARIPCTDWAVLTHVDRDRADAQAADATLWAMRIAMSLAVLVGLMLFGAWAYAGRGAWRWLWADPRHPIAYRRLAFAIALIGVVSILCLIIGARLGAAPASLHLFCVVLAPLLAWLTLWVRLGQSAAAHELRRRLGITMRAAPADRRLSPTAERNYAMLVLAMVMTVAVIPAIAQLHDSASFVVAEARRDSAVMERNALEARDRKVAAVARTYFRKLRGADLAAPEGWTANRDGLGDYRLASAWRMPDTITERSRNLSFHSRHEEPSAAARPSRTRPAASSEEDHVAAWLLIALLALALAVLLWRAAHTLLTGLFGFGVPLEAVEEPKLKRDWDWGAARDQTLVVGAPQELQREIRSDLRPDRKIRIFDLVQETDQETPHSPVDRIGHGDHVVIENLELILRDPVRRIRALRFLELIVARQRRLCDAKIVILTDLSPLERLLQRFERDAEILAGGSSPEERKQYDDLKRNREDVRWSRLFAAFATYSHRRTTDRVKPNAGRALVDAAEEAKLPENKLGAAAIRQRATIAQTVLEELSPLPAHVVRSGLPHQDDTLEAVIQKVALKIDAPSPAAVVDHFASLFIEHYQLIWSASSHAERLIMYHLAHGRLVSIARAYAVRTLVRRGVLVLDPVPRLFNRSFAQFVRNVEKPETLKRWRADAPSGTWRFAQLPILLLVPIGIAVMVMLIRNSDQHAVALVPVLVTAAPVLLQALGVMRRSGAA